MAKIQSQKGTPRVAFAFSPVEIHVFPKLVRVFSAPALALLNQNLLVTEVYAVASHHSFLAQLPIWAISE